MSFRSEHFLPKDYVAPTERPSDVNTEDDSPRALRSCIKRFYRYWTSRLITTIALVALGVRIALGGWSAWDVLPVVGILMFWPFQEWMIHVFLLHWKPKTILGRTIDPFMSQKHRRHHREPWKLDLAFMPLRALFVLPTIFATFWFLAMPTPELAMTGLAAHLLLGLHYEWVHYLTHTRYKPTTAHYKRLFRNHRLHHCKNENYWHGVTMTAADRILGTQPEPKSVERSKTVRTLGLDDGQDIITAV